MTYWWDLSAIHEALMQVLAKFVATVPAANLSAKFGELTAITPVLTFDATGVVTSSTNAPTMVHSITANAAYRSSPSDRDAS